MDTKPSKRPIIHPEGWKFAFIFPEFAEGVRALLVDKDRQPKWQYDSVHDVPDAVLETFFQEAEGAPEMHYPW